MPVLSAAAGAVQVTLIRLASVATSMCILVGGVHRSSASVTLMVTSMVSSTVASAAAAAFLPSCTVTVTV